MRPCRDFSKKVQFGEGFPSTIPQFLVHLDTVFYLFVTWQETKAVRARDTSKYR